MEAMVITDPSKAYADLSDDARALLCDILHGDHDRPYQRKHTPAEQEAIAAGCAVAYGGLVWVAQEVAHLVTSHAPAGIERTIAQLCELHGIPRSEIRAPEVPQPPDNVLELLALRSMLIDQDPAAADGHGEQMWDTLDDGALRWLIGKATRAERASVDR